MSISLGKYRIYNTNDHNHHLSFRLSDGSWTHIVINIENVLDQIIQERYYDAIFKCKDLFILAMEQMDTFLEDKNNQSLVSVMKDVDLVGVTDKSKILTLHVEAFVHGYNQVYGTNISINQILAVLPQQYQYYLQENLR